MKKNSKSNLKKNVREKRTAAACRSLCARDTASRTVASGRRCGKSYNVCASYELNNNKQRSTFPPQTTIIIIIIIIITD